MYEPCISNLLGRGYFILGIGRDREVEVPFSSPNEP